MRNARNTGTEDTRKTEIELTDVMFCTLLHIQNEVLIRSDADLRCFGCNIPNFWMIKETTKASLHLGTSLLILFDLKSPGTLRQLVSHINVLDSMRTRVGNRSATF